MRDNTKKHEAAFELINAIQSEKTENAKAKLESLLKSKIAKRIKETLEP